MMFFVYDSGVMIMMSMMEMILVHVIHMMTTTVRALIHWAPVLSWNSHRRQP